jgi:hypothetical protein
LMLDRVRSQRFHRHSRQRLPEPARHACVEHLGDPGARANGRF